MKRFDVHLHTTLQSAADLLSYISERGMEAGIVMCMKEDEPDGIEQCVKIHETYPTSSSSAATS